VIEAVDEARLARVGLSAADEIAALSSRKWQDYRFAKAQMAALPDAGRQAKSSVRRDL
jgi:hypothetical protein